MSSIVWLFPGQGSQQVGMAKALAERFATAAAVFDEASAALGMDMRALCWDAPQRELDLTVNAQPAILTVSIAALRAAEEARGAAPPAGPALPTQHVPAGPGLPAPLAVAGHSLGEYSAIVASGALSLADAVRLVRRRGELMQAADTGQGGMAAVIGLDAEVVSRALEGTGVVVANDNAPGQVVVSGLIERASDALKAAGAKRVIPLRVSAAFHSPAMRAVAPELRRAIDASAWGALRYPLIANVDADVHENAGDLPQLLEHQAWSPVRWVEIVRRAARMGADTFVEFGPGNVLTALVKRIVPEARTANVADPASLEVAMTYLT